MFLLKSKAGPNQIEIANSMARGFTIAKPEEYQDLRGFYQKVAAAEQAQLVLAIVPGATAAPTGNSAPAQAPVTVTVAPAGKGN
jgi:hypothetical protein